MSETKATQEAAPADAGASVVTLANGRKIHLREPTAGELRGVKLLDVLQLDTAVHAVVIERISELSALEFYGLKTADTMALMSKVAGFFAQDPASPPA